MGLTNKKVIMVCTNIPPELRRCQGDIQSSDPSLPEMLIIGASVLQLGVKDIGGQYLLKASASSRLAQHCSSLRYELAGSETMKSTLL